MAGRNLKRAGLAGAGLTGVVAGGVAAQRAAVRHYQKAPERASMRDLRAPSEQLEHDVIVSDGGSIHVIEQGPSDGTPAVLLLHGITLSAAVWRYQMRDLSAAGHRVVAMDFRGHGRSVAGSDGLTFDRLAGDVVEVMAALDLEDTVVVGHSMGGMVALQLLGDDPEAAVGAGRVGALALVATSASPVHHRGLPGARALVAAARPLLARGAALSARLPGPTLPAYDLAFLLARITFGDLPSPGQVSFTGGLTSEVPLRVSAELMLEIIRFDAQDVLARVRLPTAVVVGDQDVMTPVTHAEAIAAAIPDAKLIVLPGCGHMVMLERRAETDDVVTDLVSRVRGRQ